MFRLLFRLVMLVVVLGVVAMLVLGYSWYSRRPATTSPPAATGHAIDAAGARRVGTDIAEKVAAGASRAEKELEEGKLTMKIKSKMTLDDTIDVSEVSVSTSGTVVTLRGSVATRKQHQRVVQLAQETAGVTSVVDKISVRDGQ
jgi:osmotically-inducible protein OsmY